eukprot:77356_1
MSSFVGRKTEIKQATAEDLLKECKYSCCCCYFCCKWWLNCRCRDYTPLFCTLVWIFNATVWTIYTSQSILIPFNISSLYIHITTIIATLFSILSLSNILIVLYKHPGPIHDKWKHWNGQLNTKPSIPMHCRTNIDTANTDIITEMDPLNTDTITEIDSNRYCKICEIYKPPRTHHCSQCGICIDRMDHHCIWLNKCIGYNNHRYFIQFLNYYLCLTVCMIPYVVLLWIIMIYKMFKKWSLFMDMKWMIIFLWNSVLVSGGMFVLFMTIQLLRRQYFLLSNDITFIEYIYDKKITHGQYSKGTKYKNLKFYLCNPSVLYFVLPINNR